MCIAISFNLSYSFMSRLWRYSASSLSLCCIFPKYLQLFFYFSILFQLLYLILDWCLKPSLLGPFPPPLCSSLLTLSYIYFFFKTNTILLCWLALSSFDFRACSATLFSSASSFSLLLTVWMPPGLFPILPMKLAISLSFQVKFLIFSGASLPRSQAFLGLHSYFSLLSSGITPGTLTFSPIPNLP